MRLLNLLTALAGFACSVRATNNGLTDLVEWDQYSTTINGSRVFIFSAEFHNQRIPVPEMWLDVLQKIKANGFNAVSLYFFWNYHSPNKDTYDFETGAKNIALLIDYAKETGLYVVARPGPYINAESSAGGLALWGADGSAGNLRTSDITYYKYWVPWMQKIGAIIADNQITNGGPVIITQVENELTETKYSAEDTLVIYMEQIKKVLLDAGIVVPFSSNEKGQRGVSWSTDYNNVGGAVNMYGLDSYPGGLSCTNINSGFSTVRNYNQWASNYSFTQPNYFPEFRGGWFSAWGEPFYDSCLSEHDPAFADVFYKNNLGQRTTLLNLYMTYGGTNWGHSAAPVVYTSYDYSAPIRETRELQDKVYQTKLISLFTRVSKDLLKTKMVGNGTGYSVSSSAIWTWHLANPDTGANFYVLQHATSSSRNSDTFSVTLSTSVGNITVPNVNLQGRQSKLLVTDYVFGSHTLLYTSTDVLTYGVFDVDVITFYLNVGQVGQFAFKKTNKTLTYEIHGNSSLNSTVIDGIQTFIYTQGTGQTTLKFSDGLVLYLFDQKTAWKFWAPPTTINPNVPTNEQIFVIGPYLVREASVDGTIVHVSGDSNVTSTIEVYTGIPGIATIDWNGMSLPATATAWGSVTATIPGTESRSVDLPALTNWVSGNSLPEIDPNFDDSRWTVCNKTSTLNPITPPTLPVLYAADYGFYAGATIYRGYFDGLNFTAVTITASGGLAFGWTAWLNGALLGGNSGNTTLTTTTAVLPFTNTTLKVKNNIVTVLVDYHGHDETSTAKGVLNPRGLLAASLTGSTNFTGFHTWKINGGAAGPLNLDPVRGPMNEGGLYAERLGWHLPNLPSSTLNGSSSPLTGLSKSGVQFYRTTFNLSIDEDLDAPLGIELSAPAGTIARIMIWINGYQYGKYVPHIGPQTRFPIPPGIINNRGENTFALSLWAMTDNGASLSEVKLIHYGIYQTAFNFHDVGEGLQPGWEDNRSGLA